MDRVELDESACISTWNEVILGGHHIIHKSQKHLIAHLWLNKDQDSKMSAKQIRFDSIEVIELTISLGDYPSISSGPPLMIE
jgi:hypothetical protein